MANVTYQIDTITDQAVPQTSTGGAANVNITSGIGASATSADTNITSGGTAQSLFSGETPPGYKPSHAVSIIGAVTGQKITAPRW